MNAPQNNMFAPLCQRLTVTEKFLKFMIFLQSITKIPHHRKVIKFIVHATGNNDMKPSGLIIRPYQEQDWPSVWAIIEPVFRSGETYAFSPDITEEQARLVWIKKPEITFVAVGGDEQILGTYYIKPNQPTLGAHVCNCGYIVAEQARGQGVASVMCEHSQREAATRGYRAMQYNLVVSTNDVAVQLWKKLGFEIIGTLPKSFRHSRLGYVDAHVMYKQLV
jgi:ribosomal protein S18 acetylase RimI-like enzyme